MTEKAHPFVDNGHGYPTEESVRAALDMFNLGPLADVQGSFRVGGNDYTGTVVELTGQCRISDLVRGWPKGFVGQVVGIAAQASK